MGLKSKIYSFKKENVDISPNKHGVYSLYEGDELIYIGRAAGKGVTIRSRLQSHLAGSEGRCTKDATWYQREVTEDAVKREEEELEAFENEHGVLPRCNKKVA